MCSDNGDSFDGEYKRKIFMIEIIFGELKEIAIVTRVDDNSSILIIWKENSRGRRNTLNLR